MSGTSVDRVTVMLLVAAALIGGVSLGRVIGTLGNGDGELPSPSRSAAAMSPSAPARPVLPAADVAGEDLATLPRYPGSVRTAHEVFDEDGFRLVAAEYVVAAPIGDVRVFYHSVIVEHGWERVDIDYSGGEWAYLLLRGADEALVEIEEAGEVVEIDVQLSTLLGGGTPAISDSLGTVAPAAPPALPARPAAPPQAPAGEGDDDGSDDDGATDDDGNDD